ncbi:hypothetical protein [Rhizobium sp. TRM95796]|uniref:hypothetical protein n=1 Tax=Rhizobium sp. TRM95796 TaxID=2979862 RepID=UPI0021E80244|nr:hypothetical protein [Rhizobium sp. TRM95796]MCV3767553.1 hypothetical protein [Rhizobium sp. TRM95796]
MVIRYAYLWKEDAIAGRDESRKDRPCAIVLVTRMEQDDRKVLVVPVTHTPPRISASAVEIPLQVKQRLGLDSERSWVVLTELNEFIWPGPDIRPIGKTGSPVYGFLPNTFFRHLITRLAAARASRIKRT